MQSVAFIGLGLMGMPMAINLLKTGISLYAYNRSPEKVSLLINEGAKALNHPEEAFQKASIVITMLSDDKALESVCLERARFVEINQTGMHSCFYEHGLPSVSRKLESLHREKGAYFVAAPVFGRPQVAAMAKLWICIAGDQKAKKQVEPILKFLGQRIEDFGEDVGKANIVKLSGNFLIMSAFEAMGEAYAVAKENGLDPQQLASFFGETLFPSPIYQAYGKMIASETFVPPGLTIALGLKDLELMQTVASSSRIPMPLAQLLQKHLKKGKEHGRAEWDWSAISVSAIEDK